jgi:hypothetical protein
MLYGADVREECLARWQGWVRTAYRTGEMPNPEQLEFTGRVLGTMNQARDFLADVDTYRRVRAARLALARARRAATVRPGKREAQRLQIGQQIANLEVMAESLRLVSDSPERCITQTTEAIDRMERSCPRLFGAAHDPNTVVDHAA